ncbi:MAG: exosortase H, partial [Syntrophaceae bacterium]|nr:exosortase H [Syntrophaceae bacterium]
WLGFASAFSLCCVVVYFSINALPEPYTRPINEHTARMLARVLQAFRIRVLVQGDTVAGSGIGVRIITECTPVFMWGLFLPFVLFYQAPIEKKGWGLAAGIPALYLGNLVRLVAVFMAGRHDRRLFEIVHVYLGQVFTLSLVLLACGIWLKWIEREKSGQSMGMKSWGFPARLAPISIGLFFLWLQVHHGYLRIIDRVMSFGFSLLSYRLIIPYEYEIYYETFNTVAFSSLVLATGSIPAERKIKGLLAGLGILFLVHLLYRTCNLLVTGFHLIPLIAVGLTLASIGQYLLPVILYLRLAAPNALFPSKAPFKARES